ncbi:MAG TPA: Holliday junction branch migration protein RuvA [Candidatus Babeliales bacterium]|nr:Holliday junction branch migration protein RuvA [Candidatus Babeliales bacterium]
MLSYVTGLVKLSDKQQIVIDVGGIGFTIQVPNGTAFTLNEPTTIQTYLHWNQEQGPSLFGFSTELDKTVFLLIISCSGLGPKIGLTILDSLGAAAFLEAVQTGNDAALYKINGIGAKKAEQIIVQLKHKVAQLLKSGIDLGSTGTVKQLSTVSQVLSSLNYTQTEISRTMKHLNDAYPDNILPFDVLMRHALSFLSKLK